MHPKALLEACTGLVGEMLKLEHPADAVVARYFRENRSLGSRERATAAETGYAVLRKRALLEHLASSGSGPRARRLAILAFAGPRDLLQGALSADEQAWLAQCDAVAAADLPEPLRHNMPAWLAQALQEQVGEDFWALVKAFDGTAPLDVRVNALVGKRDEVRQELAAAGIESTPTPYSPWGLRIAGKPSLGKLDVFTRGAIEVQDEGSQLLALLLDARRGQMVVDFCAGAGGKTLALGAAMRDTGRLYAFDVSAHRLEALKPRLARARLTNVHPAAIAHERDERIARLAGKMDRVIVDAPCSGLGTLRRNPDLKWRQTPQEIEELVAKQTAILESAARLLKPGGRLVYATCSVLPQENEQVAAAFSQAHRDFQAVPVQAALQQLKAPAAADLCSGAEGAFLRLWPHRHGTDGFFAAAWERAR
ncbi:RsmB/NOP family class I SAM-dependent RNA methyltransferase [Caenimonas sedimenti]|uniref:RsmB/NOP family class I SAM-dependent RNA methyltransferase n=1 Tax=Caenimonas sedimenti TaxID=2596921 RepID=A0A562ZV32_9BURK|nr:RsmB/NOP family class I SAM-dependent RNA methyltransferase [Caenimonas sedimenti]TWO72333.1 RsmB/NOP family class I SAM-dependent RNA methyltransferase [Caenimonas sedimenti]